MDRREFIQWQLKALVFLILGPKFSWAQTRAEKSMVVAVQGEPAKALEIALKELGGIQSFLKPNSNVVLKPNMSFRNSPEMATTTNPNVLRAVVDLISRESPKSIKVLDNTLTDPEACMKNTGIKDALKGSMAELKVIKEKQGYQEVQIKGKSLGSTDIMKEVLSCDALIPVPVAKHHSSTGVSLSMKGMMGLIYERSSFHYKYDLHTAIVDLAAYLKPRLVIIDMTRALTTNGPSGPGEVEILNTIVASNDMVAADAYVVSKVKWYGRQMDPFKVKHIAIAHEMKVGVGNLKEIEIVEKVA